MASATTAALVLVVVALVAGHTSASRPQPGWYAEVAASTPTRPSRDPHRKMTVIATGLERRATLGDYCLQRPERYPGEIVANECADRRYEPTPSPISVPIASGSVVVIHPGAPARRITVSFERPLRSRKDAFPVALRAGHRRDGQGSWWTIRAPEGVRRSTVLRVYAEFADQGNAEFFLGIKAAAGTN